MEEIYKSINQKQKINYNDKVKRYYNITTSKIETDEGLKKLFKLQYHMLYKLINSNITFMSDQSNVLYYNYCFFIGKTVFYEVPEAKPRRIIWKLR